MLGISTHLGHITFMVFDHEIIPSTHLYIMKNTYSNILKILQPKKENFQIKNSDIFYISAQKHRLWVLFRTALARRF